MPLIDGLSRKRLHENALAALLAGNTLAEGRVYEPRDWPTTPEWFPILLVSAPRERSVGMFPGLNEFTTTITLTLVGRVIADTPDAACKLLDILEEQIKEVLLLSPDFQLGIQLTKVMDTSAVVTAAGRNHLGELGMVFDFDVYQAYGPWGPRLIDVNATMPPSPTGDPVVIDLKPEE